jgi:hypothetical protein
MGEKGRGGRKKQKVFVETTNWGVSSTRGVSSYNGRFYNEINFTSCLSIRNRQNKCLRSLVFAQQNNVIGLRVNMQLAADPDVVF